VKEKMIISISGGVNLKVRSRIRRVVIMDQNGQTVSELPEEKRGEEVSPDEVLVRAGRMLLDKADYWRDDKTLGLLMHDKDKVDQYTLWALVFPTEKFADEARQLISKYLGHYVAIDLTDENQKVRIVVGEEEPQYSQAKVPDWPYSFADLALPDLQRRLLRYEGYQEE
jgi:hypothetical protein